MLSNVALGELLLVAAVPAAVVLAMIGAMIARRYRRIALALGVLSLLTMATMIMIGRSMIRPLTDLRAAQKAHFASMEVGLDAAQVRERLGEPDLICAGDGYHAHKVRGTSELETKLYAATEERWIYFAKTLTDVTKLEDREGCKPLFGEGEVAYNADGQVIWFISMTDDEFLTF